MGVAHLVEGVLCVGVGLLIWVGRSSLERWYKRVYPGFPTLFPNWSFRVPPASLLFLAVGAAVFAWGIAEVVR